MLAAYSGYFAALTSSLRAPALRPAIRVAPNGAGNLSGDSWANAARLSSINTLIARAAATGAEIWLRADAGEYAQAAALTINSGGTSKDARVRICGVDVNGLPMKAVIRGNRANPWSVGASGGSDIFRLNAGADHLIFSDLEFHDQGSGCFRVRQTIYDLTITDCSAYNVSRFFEDTAAGTTNASIFGLTIQRCEAHGFSKAFARVAYDSTDILIEDCFGDSQRQDGDDFAIGIGFRDRAHHAVVRRCVMKNMIDTTRAYQNGDGFSGELRNDYITLEDCACYNCTDGGVDFKGDYITLIRFHSEGNHRNYRLWGLASLIDCVGLTPTDNAGFNGYDRGNVCAFGGAMVSVYGGYFEDKSTIGGRRFIFLAEAGGIIAVSPSTKTGGTAPYKFEEGVSGSAPAGIVTTLNPNDRSIPVVDPAMTSFSIDENKSSKVQLLAADRRPITIRFPRDANGQKSYASGAVSNSGCNLIINRQDYEAKDANGNPLPNPRLGQIYIHDGNGNRSALTTISVTVNDVSDDPIAETDLIADGCTDFAWWDPSRPGGVWQDSAMTLPATEDDDPVRAITDFSGKGHHWKIADEDRPAKLGVGDGGAVWIESDGVVYFQLAVTAELKFPFVTSTQVIQRDKVNQDTRNIISHASGNNFAWGQSVTGGATYRVTLGGSNASVPGGGGAATNGANYVLGYQTQPFEGRSNEALVINPSATDNNTRTYLSGSRARLFSDGNGQGRFIGRWYGGVVTNRTENDAFRYRLARQFGLLAGLNLN